MSNKRLKKLKKQKIEEFRKVDGEDSKNITDDELGFYIINFGFCKDLGCLDNLHCLFKSRDEILYFEKELVDLVNNQFNFNIDAIFLTDQLARIKTIPNIDDMIDKFSVQTLDECTSLPVSRKEIYFHDYPEYTELYVTYIKQNGKWIAPVTAYKLLN
uniref:Uncharacterized protein n=1 Tax=viral metagenome TaxID=1070528 RepID=A0A6C0F8A1_9ZZZZ